jgi:hypothetical protein
MSEKLPINNSKILENFVEVVREYVALVDNLESMSASKFLSRCSVLLPQIFSLGQDLPWGDTGENEEIDKPGRSHEEFLTLMTRIDELIGEKTRYNLVYQPTEDDEVVTSTLGDDLADIYFDLSEPLKLYDSNISANQQEAIWCWKFSLVSHIGFHIAHAIGPIYWLVLEQEDSDE